MKILVTGASGMLGAAVAGSLQGRGDEPIAFQRGECPVAGVPTRRGSLTDAEALDRAVDGVDAVIHLAAKVSISGPEDEFERINVAGTRNLIDAMRRGGVTKLVNISSPSVAHAGAALVGIDAGEADPSAARGPYARTKAAAELIAMAADGDDFHVVTIRPHVVWGPGDTQLVERIIERARSGRMPLLNGGRALMDSTYVDNAVGAILAALDRIEDVHGEVFVVTNGEPRPVAEFMGLLARAGGADAPSRNLPAALAKGLGSVVERVWGKIPGRDEPPMTRFLAEQLSTAHWFDQRRTRERLRWSPQVSLEDGAERVAEYYRNGRAPKND